MILAWGKPELPSSGAQQEWWQGRGSEGWTQVEGPGLLLYAMQGGTVLQAICNEDCAPMSFPVAIAFTCADEARQGPRGRGLRQVLTRIT